MIRFLERPEASWTAADHVARAIGNIGPAASTAVPALIRYYERKEVHEGAGYAVLSLGRVRARPAESVPILTRALEDKRLPLDWAAAALARFEEEAAPSLPVVIRLLEVKGADEADRAALMWVLESIGPEAREAVRIVEPVVRDESAGEDLRVSAIRALGRIGSPSETLPILEAVLASPSTKQSDLVRSTTLETIAKTRIASGG
jgi:hypothetical protein